MKLEEIFDLTEDFKETLSQMYPKKVVDKVKIVDVRSLDEKPELKELIEKNVPKSKIQKKQCFGNAATIATLIDDVDYVEGFVGMNLGAQILPIEHAWNVYKGEFHFDITSEQLFGGDITHGEKNYAQLTVIEDPEKAREAANDVKRACYYAMKD